MKLVVIYGPPGVGKLTVAKELSKMTGYKVLHNHLVIDMVEAVFERESKKFWELIDAYRLHLADIAAQERVDGIVLTSAYIKGQDDKFIKDLIGIPEKYSGSIHFVKLNCELKELKARMQDPSRKAHKKLRDVKKFEEFASKNEVFKPIDFVESFTIDNTNISAEEAAMRIKEHYKL